MKRIIRYLGIIGVAALMCVMAVPAVNAAFLSTSMTDAFEGATVTNSPAGAGQFRGVFTGANPEAEMVTNALFWDGVTGTVNFVNFSTASPATLVGIRLTAASDGAAFSNRRSMNRFALKADLDNNGSYETTLIDQPINTNYALQPGNVASEQGNLDLTLYFPTRVTASAFRAEFTQGVDSIGFDGVRVNELDAIAPPWMPTSGLVAHYPLDGQPNDLSSNSLNGTVETGTGTPVSAADRFTASAGAYTMNGGYIQVADGDASPLDLTMDFTISAWIRPSSFPFLGGIVGKYHAGDSPNYVFRLGGGANFRGLNFNGVQTADDILAADTWYHVVGVNNAGTSSIYINGTQVSTTGPTIGWVPDNAPLTIGVDYLADPRYFAGQIDDVLIYNRVLTAQEISFIYTNAFDLTVTKAGTGTGTVKSAPAGINCGTVVSDCSETLAANTLVTLTAIPSASSRFSGWSGACTGTGSCEVTMNEVKKVTATFARRCADINSFFPPPTSTTTSLRLAWSNSRTPGVEYVLTSNGVEVYRGPNLYAYVSTPVSGIYNFTLRAVKATYADSLIKLGSTNIVLTCSSISSFYPPATASPGYTRLVWSKSGTPGVEYVLTQNGVEVYRGPNLSTYVNLPASGEYTFALWAEKPGYANSIVKGGKIVVP